MRPVVGLVPNQSCDFLYLISTFDDVTCDKRYVSVRNRKLAIVGLADCVKFIHTDVIILEDEDVFKFSNQKSEIK